MTASRQLRERRALHVANLVLRFGGTPQDPGRRLQAPPTSRVPQTGRDRYHEDIDTQARILHPGSSSYTVGSSTRQESGLLVSGGVSAPPHIVVWPGQNVFRMRTRERTLPFCALLHEGSSRLFLGVVSFGWAAELGGCRATLWLLATLLERSVRRHPTDLLGPRLGVRCDHPDPALVVPASQAQAGCEEIVRRSADASRLVAVFRSLRRTSRDEVSWRFRPSRCA